LAVLLTIDCSQWVFIPQNSDVKQA